jgi:hypothetical protein
MEEPIKKMIIISDCMECYLIKDCKAWKKLTPKQKFTLKYGVDVGKFILKDCPLDNVPSNMEV